MSSREKKELIFTLSESYVRNRLIVEFLPNGKLAYFVQFRLTFMGEFEELFFHVTSSYCVENAVTRKQFYKSIETAARELKTYEKIRKIMMEVSFDDEISKKYYSKKGLLTYIELVGNTSVGLKALKDVDLKRSSIKISKLEKKDIVKLIDLDLKSHIEDKTSRMRRIFMKPDAKKGMKMFYNALLNRGGCLVAKEKNKLVGDIGYFINEENQWGLIAAIFVANDFKNRGVSKILYKKLLMEFQKRNLKYYIGATTTTGVLATARKIGRVESKYSYILKI